MSALTAFFYYRSLSILPASTAIVMLFQFVWIGLALELWHKRRAPTKIEIFSVLLCYVGTYLSVGFDGAEAKLYGLLLGFLSGAAFAVYIFFSSSFCLDEEPDARAFWIIFSAFAVIFVMGVFDLDFTHLLAIVKWGSICGLLGVFVPFYIYALFSPRIGAGATSLIGSAELPAALFLSMLMLGERLSNLQIIGSLFVIFAIFIVFLAEAKAK